MVHGIHPKSDIKCKEKNGTKSYQKTLPALRLNPVEPDLSILINLSNQNRHVKITRFQQKKKDKK